MKKFSRKTVIPFAGFYSSYHDSELDMAFEQMFGDSSGRPYEKLQEIAYFDCSWRHVHVEYAKLYVEALAQEYELKVIFEELDSPREYNFTTDRIFVYIPLAEVHRLRRETPDAIFREVCKEQLTSRDGFSSSYSPDPDDWRPMRDWDHNHIAMLVQAYIRSKNNGDDLSQEQELSLIEDDRGNGALDSIISEALGKEGIRALNVASYLWQRSERKYRLPQKRADATVRST